MSPQDSKKRPQHCSDASLKLKVTLRAKHCDWCSVGQEVPLAWHFEDAYCSGWKSPPQKMVVAAGKRKQKVPSEHYLN